jgi:hypothetical protein
VVSNSWHNSSERGDHLLCGRIEIQNPPLGRDVNVCIWFGNALDSVCCLKPSDVLFSNSIARAREVVVKIVLDHP